MKAEYAKRTNNKGFSYLQGMKYMALGIAIILGWTACAAASAEGARSAQAAAEAVKKQPAPALHVPLLTEGVKLSDFAGMKPRPELKDKLLKITGFIQNSPHDGQPASEETEVWLGYTKSTFYLVFICYDHHRT
jgi:hypothetical protein